MRLSLAKQKAPVIIGVVKERTPREASAAIRNCEIHGATGIDLHVSFLEEEYRTVSAMEGIIAKCRLPVMALNYNIGPNGDLGMDEEARLDLLQKAALAGAAAIDMQGYSFDAPSKKQFDSRFADAGYSFIQGAPREVVVNPEVIERQKAFIGEIHAIGAEVLMSHHPGIPMNADQLVDLARFIQQRGVDMIKIVSIARDDDDLAESFRAMLRLKKEISLPVAYHCGGAPGRLSRIINPMLGGFLAFCNDGYGPASDLDQLDVASARSILDMTERIR